MLHRQQPVHPSERAGVVEHGGENFCGQSSRDDWVVEALEEAVGNSRQCPHEHYSTRMTGLLSSLHLLARARPFELFSGKRFMRLALPPADPPPAG
jgi:hypothetical protein